MDIRNLHFGCVRELDNGDGISFEMRNVKNSMYDLYNIEHVNFNDLEIATNYLNTLEYEGKDVDILLTIKDKQQFISMINIHRLYIFLLTVILSHILNYQ